MLSYMAKQIDCVVCGSCAVDLVCRPVELEKPIGVGVLHETADPVVLTTGGITCNSGITMARLGLKVAVLSYIGDDEWGPVVRGVLQKEGIDDTAMTVHPTAATSTTIVAVDATGERSFFHCVGAPKELNGTALLDHLDLFSRSATMLLGYYSLMPNVESDLPQMFQRIRQTGCQTAMDTAGHGGTMKPLDRTLPHLDIYIPSFGEASHQTGLNDPYKMIEMYRNCGAPGLLGVKLGSKGVLLSPKAGDMVEIGVIAPPGKIADTTGAGDSFYAGLIAGLCRGMPAEHAGRLGAASAACCVTAVGGSAGGRSYEETARLAGIG